MDNKESKNNSIYIKWGLTIFITAAAIILFYYFIFHIERVISLFNSIMRIVSPILIGFVMAYLMTPIVNGLEGVVYVKILKKKEVSAKVKKWIRMLSIIFTMSFFFFLIYEFFALIIPEIKNSIDNISSQLTVYVENLENWVNNLMHTRPQLNGLFKEGFDEISEQFNDWLNNDFLDDVKGWMPKVEDILKTFTTGVFSVFKVLWNTVIGLIISFYLIFGKEKFAGQAKKIVYALFQKNTANTFIHNVRFINKTFLGFITGKIADSIIIGFMCFILTTIIGTPYPILISVIIGVTNVIPFFGPYIGAIPCAFLVLLVNPLECLYFVIMIFLLQQFDGNILGPKILGDSTGITGFWVIFAITLFGGILGIPGMIIGVPLFAVIYAIIKAFIKSNLDEKNLSRHTEDYIKVDFIDENNNFMQIPRDEVMEIVTGKRYGIKKLKYKVEPVEDIINSSDLNKEAENHSAAENSATDDDKVTSKDN